MNKPRKMIRKTIYMPGELVAKIDATAKELKVSFPEMVRQAADFCTLSQEEIEGLEPILDNAVQGFQKGIKKIDALNKRLNKTHALLEKSRNRSPSGEF